LGKGSTFVLKLPVHPECEVSENSSWALLVDDQKSVADFYFRISKNLGFEGRTAASLDEAREALDDLGRPHYVITDLQLGSGSGFEMIELIRARFGTLVPILVVSGVPDDDIEKKVKRAGADDFIAKPVSRKVLFSRIESLLGRNDVI